MKTMILETPVDLVRISPEILHNHQTATSLVLTKLLEIPKSPDAHINSFIASARAALELAIERSNELNP